MSAYKALYGTLCKRNAKAPSEDGALQKTSMACKKACSASLEPGENYTTLAKIITSVNSTRDSMKASPRISAS
jgi:hypothetical protein